MERRKIVRILRRIAVGVLATLVLALVTLKLLYGRGTPYPDASSTPLVADKDVAAVVTLDFPPGNVAGSKDGRVFFNLHPIAHPYRFTDAFLFELVDGRPRPYPDAASQPDLRFVFGMTVDRQNRLWLTAPAAVDQERTHLFAYDLTSNTKVIDRELDPGVARFGQDLRITPDGKTVLLANASAFRFTSASLVVLDIATWTSRELLIGDPSTQAQDWLMTVRGGPYRVAYGLINFAAGLDGISISPDGQWLFLAPMSNDTLFRVPLADVLDPAISPSALSARVTRVGKKPLSDGIEAASDGSVLVTDVEHGGIARVDARGGLQTLVRLGGVSWADGVVVGPSGNAYFTDSAIPRYIDPFMRPPTLDRLRSGRSYHLYRFRLPP
jgi:DNA-binding beta-propeller fold protein YncE